MSQEIQSRIKALEDKCQKIYDDPKIPTEIKRDLIREIGREIVLLKIQSDTLLKGI